MISPKYDPSYIEQELRNSRRLVEKSIEFSKRYTPTDSSSEKLSELLEKLRNEEYLKNSYEKALKENLVFLKEEQKKNMILEQKVEFLEQKITELNNQRFCKIIERIEDIENHLKKNYRSSCEPNESRKTRVCRNSVSVIEDIDQIRRMEIIQKRVEGLEKAVMGKSRNLQTKSKSMKTLGKKKK
jgi:hypothetical protein